MSYPDTYPDIISVRSFISKQFPTLLAIREIIADAFIIIPQKSYRHPALRDSQPRGRSLYRLRCFWQYLLQKYEKKVERNALCVKKLRKI